MPKQKGEVKSVKVVTTENEEQIEKFTSLLEEAVRLITSVYQLEWKYRHRYLEQEINNCFYHEEI